MINLKHYTMDHIVCLDARAKEMENLVNGIKSMIIRGAEKRKIPHGRVNEGDVLYFANNNGEIEVKARGLVSSVLNFEKLTVEESFETIIRHQDKLQLPDKQFEKVAGKSYLLLISLNEIEEVKPFRIDNTCFAGMNGWIPVGKIESVTIPIGTGEVTDREQ
jgi:hypothetical protein